MAVNTDTILNLVSQFIPSFNVDSVAVFTQDYTQVFRGGRPIKAVVKENSKLMEHPIESGAVVTDHRILLPIEIELSLILRPDEYRETYNQIKQLYEEGTFLIVQTRSGIYTNQLIQGLPHEEDPTIFDTITIALSLKQVQMVTAQYTTTPRNPKNSSTTQRGVLQTTEATPTQNSKAYEWLQSVAVR